MCLIIDICCVPKVFDQSSKEHHRFVSVRDWVTRGRGRVIYGGEKYKRELKGMREYVRLFANLNRQGRLIEVDDKAVDLLAAQLKIKVKNRDFNDEHLIALVAVSRCRVICSDDKKAYPFLKRKNLYPSGVRPPKIFRHAQHKTLCCSDNIVGVCR